MPDYTQDGPSLLPDQILIVGNTWRVDLVLEDYDDETRVSTPYDLTGVTGAAKIRVEPSGAVVATPTVSITSAADGEVAVELEPGDTDSLAPGTYRVGVQLTWTGGEVWDIAEGTVIVRRGLVS